MSERTLEQHDTLCLVEKFLQVNQRIESISNAKWWQKPHWWLIQRLTVLNFIMHKKLDELMSFGAELSGELATRYSGITFDLFTCAGHPTSLFDKYYREVWIELQGKATTARDPRRFSTCLWEIQQRRGATLDDLKPKFMLRQFVDELPDGEARGALKLLVYSADASSSSPKGWSQRRKEAARMVKKGYTLLHEQVSARANDLEILTGGQLNTGMIGEIGFPYTQYDEWLFYEC